MGRKSAPAAPPRTQPKRAAATPGLTATQRINKNKALTQGEKDTALAVLEREEEATKRENRRVAATIKARRGKAKAKRSVAKSLRKKGLKQAVAKRLYGVSILLPPHKKKGLRRKLSDSPAVAAVASASPPLLRAKVVATGAVIPLGLAAPKRGLVPRAPRRASKKKPAASVPLRRAGKPKPAPVADSPGGSSSGQSSPKPLKKKGAPSAISAGQAAKDPKLAKKYKFAIDERIPGRLEKQFEDAKNPISKQRSKRRWEALERFLWLFQKHWKRDLKAQIGQKAWEKWAANIIGYWEHRTRQQRIEVLRINHKAFNSVISGLPQRAAWVAPSAYYVSEEEVARSERDLEPASPKTVDSYQPRA